MERRRRLGDLLARAAGELFPHGLDHLPLPRHPLQRLGNGLAELGEPAAAARTHRRAGDHDALAPQVRRKRRPHRLLAGERPDRRAISRSGAGFVLGRACRRFLELQFHLVEQLAAAFGGLPILLAPQLGDQQLVVATSASALEARASAWWRASRSLASAAFSASSSSGRLSGVVTGPIVTGHANCVAAQPQGESIGRRFTWLLPAARYEPGCANRARRAKAYRNIPSAVRLTDPRSTRSRFWTRGTLFTGDRSRSFAARPIEWATSRLSMKSNIIMDQVY
jgi:hypothetical protein